MIDRLVDCSVMSTVLCDTFYRERESALHLSRALLVVASESINNKIIKIFMMK
jgi:hypothetical protein